MNEAVRNNPEKFPARYMFELTTSELQDLRSKILISNVSPNNRKPTKVFTEKGLYMLAKLNFFIGKLKHTVKRVRKEK